MATSSVKEVLPPTLGPNSEPPPVFDGTTRLYIAYICPFAQRAWIARNYKLALKIEARILCSPKGRYTIFCTSYDDILLPRHSNLFSGSRAGLQDKIKLVAIDLQDRPAWYKEKVNPANKVPALEHNNQVIGESLDVVKYIDSNFEGPALLPNDPVKREFAEELLSYSDTMVGTVFSSFKGDPTKEAVSTFDFLENALHKFDDGPFFLGEFSMVDIAYVTFIERFYLFLKDAWNYDLTSGRPKLASWFEEMNKIDVYTQTKYDPQKLVEYFRGRFLPQK